MKTTENPIRVFISALLNSGQTTKEKICVAADLKYDTFNNIFVRPRVSVMIRKSLLFSGIITKGVYDDYEAWLRDVYKPAQKASKAKRRSSSYSEVESEGNSEAFV